jgi:hypothetical protein
MGNSSWALFVCCTQDIEQEIETDSPCPGSSERGRVVLDAPIDMSRGCEQRSREPFVELPGKTRPF